MGPISITLVVLAIPTLIWLIHRENSKTKDILNAKLLGLSEVNAKHGTSFPSTQEELKTSFLLGDQRLLGNAMIFDPQKRRIALIKAPGNSLELQDFDFIQSWKVDLYTITKGHTGVHIAIGTNDLKSPLIHFAVSNVNAGDEWMARLNTMLA